MHGPACGRRPPRRACGARLRMTDIETASGIVLARHWSSEACAFPSPDDRGKRSADRRSGAAAPVGGRVTYARRRLRGALRSSGNARLSALHRGGLWAPVPPWRNLRALHMSGALGLALAHSRVPLVVAEGRFCRAPPGSRLRAEHAGRHIPLRLRLVSGDALGERDTAKVAWNGGSSSERRSRVLIACR